MAPNNETARDERLWQPWQGGTLYSSEDYARYFAWVEARLFEADGRINDNTADIKNMARDLKQLVGVRMDQKDGGQEDPVAVIAAALAGKKNNAATTTQQIQVPVTPSDPHRNPATPPQVEAMGSLQQAGFTADFDPAVTPTDESGLVRLTNNGGVPFSLFQNDDAFRLIYGTAYQQKPFPLAFAEGDVSGGGPTISMVYYFNPKNGGTKNDCIFQAVLTGSQAVPVGGVIRIHYHIKAGVAG